MIHRRLSLDLPDYSKQRQSGHHQTLSLAWCYLYEAKKFNSLQIFFKKFSTPPLQL